MPFAAALSEHPLATHAVGEVVGEVLERLGEAPDLAILFVSADHTGVVEDIAASVRQLLRPRVLVGCTAGTVVGGDREVEDQPAVTLWAGRIPVVQAYRLRTERVGPENVAPRAIRGFPAAGDLPPGGEVVLLLADPFTFPTDAFLAGLTQQVGVDLPVVGGMASAARGPGGNRILVGDHIYGDGAVAVVLGGVDTTTVVSQGCRPIGDPMAVTAASGNLIAELAGRRALDRVQEVLGALPPDDAQRARRGLHVGRVIDDRKAEFERGDFLVRNVLGADRASGAVAVGDEMAVGAVVQLQVRDADSADDDLRHHMAGRHADGALLFTCNGRGSLLFGTPDHDAQVVSDALGRVAVAGMSCAGEVGPVGGRSFIHGFTASVLLFADRGKPLARGGLHAG